MNRITNPYHKLINSRTRSLFLLELVFLVILLALILPLINIGIDITFHSWGQSYITFQNIQSYLSSPQTLLFLLLSIVLISFFLCFQMITLICCSEDRLDVKQTKLLQYLLIAFLKMKRCFNSQDIALPFFTLFIFELANLPVLICITFKVKLSFLGNANLGFIKVLLLLVYAWIALIAFRGMFVVHFYTKERRSFLESLELSKKMLKGRSIKIFRSLLFSNLMLSVGSIIIYYIILLFSALFIFLTVDPAMVIMEFLSVYPRISFILLVLFQMVTYITNINVITNLFIKYHKEDYKDTFPNQTPIYENPKATNRKKFKLSLNAFLLFVIATGLTNFYMTVQSDSFYLQNALAGIQVSSHRGNSHVAPENTLPALENAIIAGSDYAEIDVRETKDGVLILMHDSNLKRTAGLNRKIETLNLKELSELDAGSWFSTDFARTKIPTLEEAIELCRGKIKLNIEVKADQKGSTFEEDLVALIKALDFENQCLVSSTDYRTLFNIKQLNPRLRTGLILSATYGNYFDKVAVDFFSISSNNITRQVVENAHRAGKEVHAWTVNKVSEIERMKSIGVDCIITDNPTLTKEVLFQEDVSMSFIDLLNRLLSDSR